MMSAASEISRPGSTRAIEIALRTAHIGAMAILFGGHHFAAGQAWQPP